VVDIGQGPLKLANPRIVNKKGSGVMEEGCLSLPGIMIKVKRAEQVVVAAQNEFGERIEIQAEGLLARVLQHEIDHLKGILIIDYLPWLKRIMLKRKLSE
jgi:peptide deformylase